MGNLIRFSRHASQLGDEEKEELRKHDLFSIAKEFWKTEEGLTAIKNSRFGVTGELK